MGLIYETHNQIACLTIDNGKMTVIAPQIDTAHHGQNLYRRHWLNHEGYGPTEGFCADQQR